MRVTFNLGLPLSDRTAIGVGNNSVWTESKVQASERHQHSHSERLKRQSAPATKNYDIRDKVDLLKAQNLQSYVPKAITEEKK